MKDQECVKVLFAQFRYEGASRAYFFERRVESMDIDALEIPKGSSAFRFFTRYVFNINDKEVKSKKMNVSSWYYMGKEYSLEEIKDKIPHDQYQKFYKYGYRRVVVTDVGKIIPLRAIDKVITKK